MTPRLASTTNSSGVAGPWLRERDTTMSPSIHYTAPSPSALSLSSRENASRDTGTDQARSRSAAGKWLVAPASSSCTTASSTCGVRAVALQLLRQYAYDTDEAVELSYAY